MTSDLVMDLEVTSDWATDLDVASDSVLDLQVTVDWVMDFLALYSLMKSQERQFVVLENQIVILREYYRPTSFIFLDSNQLDV